jgi:hypothetical protein
MTDVYPRWNAFEVFQRGKHIYKIIYSRPSAAVFESP